MDNKESNKKLRTWCILTLDAFSYIFSYAFYYKSSVFFVTHTLNQDKLITHILYSIKIIPSIDI